MLAEIKTDTPLCMMTVGEFLEVLDAHLIAKRNEEESSNNNLGEYEMIPETKYVFGIQGIANLFNCSLVTAHRIKRSGKIDEAITQIGRKIVVDAELALKLARERTWQNKRGRYH